MKHSIKFLSAIIFLAGLTAFAGCSAGPKESATAPAKQEPAAAPAPVEHRITVGTNFEPKSVEVKKGQPVKLAFFRKDGENCGDEVVFPSLNITKKLPVGETVTVEFTPQEAGEVAFTCGMDMMRGKVVVQ